MSHKWHIHICHNRVLFCIWFISDGLNHPKENVHALNGQAKHWEELQENYKQCTFKKIRTQQRKKYLKRWKCDRKKCNITHFISNTCNWLYMDRMGIGKLDNNFSRKGVKINEQVSVMIWRWGKLLVRLHVICNPKIWC